MGGETWAQAVLVVGVKCCRLCQENDRARKRGKKGEIERKICLFNCCVENRLEPELPRWGILEKVMPREQLLLSGEHMDLKQL